MSPDRLAWKMEAECVERLLDVPPMCISAVKIPHVVKLLGSMPIRFNVSFATHPWQQNGLVDCTHSLTSQMNFVSELISLPGVGLSWAFGQWAWPEDLTHASSMRAACSSAMLMLKQLRLHHCFVIVSGASVLSRLHSIWSQSLSELQITELGHLTSPVCGRGPDLANGRLLDSSSVLGA